MLGSQLSTPHAFGAFCGAWMEIARQSDLNINFIAAATVGLSDSCLFVITNYLQVCCNYVRTGGVPGDCVWVRFFLGLLCSFVLGSLCQCIASVCSGGLDSFLDTRIRNKTEVSTFILCTIFAALDFWTVRVQLASVSSERHQDSCEVGAISLVIWMAATSC